MNPYVPGKPIDEVERELGITGVSKLASNENPLGPSPKVYEALVMGSKSVHRYPDGSAFCLKKALAKYLNIEEDSLLLGNGSNELLILLAEAVLTPETEVLYAVPSFVVYPIATQLFGAIARPIPLYENKHDLKAFANALSSKTRLVFICNPNNPTGTMVSLLAIEAFLKICPPTVLVVLDEAYYEYVEEKTYFESVQLLNRYSNLVILRTFSKVFGLAGLRIGYGMARPELVETIQRFRQPFSINSLALIAAEAALQDRSHLSKVVQLNKAMREKIQNGLKQLGILAIPSQANFVYFQIQNSSTIYEKLLNQGVIVRQFGPEALRVSTGTEEETERFLISFKNAIIK
jgi:histidinol-phosphate aminotransferase